jgi:hypothetical protein
MSEKDGSEERKAAVGPGLDQRSSGVSEVGWDGQLKR